MPLLPRLYGFISRQQKIFATCLHTQFHHFFNGGRVSAVVVVRMKWLCAYVCVSCGTL